MIRKSFESRPNPERPRDVSIEMTALSVDSHGLAPVATRMNDRSSTPEFDRLFAEHYTRLVRSLTIVSGDAESAADAVQEAFVKAHLRWRTVGRYDDPVAWVRTVALNRLRDDYRHLERRRRILPRLARQSATTSPPPELDEFDRLLASLSKQQRAVTALHYVDGMPIAEIAEALGIAEGSVKSHLFDARRRLRPMLEREAADDRPKDSRT